MLGGMGREDTRSCSARLREEISAGGVVLRPGPGGPEVALAEQRDRNTGSLTVRLPKGKCDAGENLEQTARREVLEETGLTAEILRSLGDVRYRYFELRAKQHVDKRVHFFLMRHDGSDPAPRDSEMERVYWAPLAEAAARLSFDTEREVLARARAALESHDLPGAWER